jgi:hypothetical protein
VVAGILLGGGYPPQHLYESQKKGVRKKHFVS